jgi:PadR family transcriptional regulator, regulatory protein AphA
MAWYTLGMARTTPDANASAPLPRLSPVSYVVLGFLERSGELTSYDLKQKVEGSVGYFWPFPHTQLYEEPKRLEHHGLVASRTEPDGRRRRTWSITDAGRAALDAWLDVADDSSVRITDTGLLQLFFGATGSQDANDVRERTRALARARRATHEARLAEYEAIERAIASGAIGDGDIAPGGCTHQTLRAGQRMEQLMIDFWTGVEAEPPSAC